MAKQIILTNHFGTTTYEKGKTEEFDVKEYITTTGLYTGKITQVFGTESKDGRSSFVTFEITTEDGSIVQGREFNAYTDKTTNKIVEAKGGRFVKALIAFNNKGKDKAICKWVPDVQRQFGKDVSGVTAKPLLGTEVTVYAIETRSFYTNKDNEEVAKSELVIDRLFNSDGQSLHEQEHDEFEGKAMSGIKKRMAKKLKKLEEDGKPLELCRYKEGVDPDEWIMIKGVSSDGNANTSDDTAEDDGDLDVEDNSTPQEVVSDTPKAKPATTPLPSLEEEEAPTANVANVANVANAPMVEDDEDDDL